MNHSLFSSVSSRVHQSYSVLSFSPSAHLKPRITIKQFSDVQLYSKQLSLTHHNICLTQRRKKLQKVYETNINQFQGWINLMPFSLLSNTVPCSLLKSATTRSHEVLTQWKSQYIGTSLLIMSQRK